MGKSFLLSASAAALLCLVWFALYERKKASSLEAVLVALLVAFGTLGRVAFAALPHFKPVAAVTIVAGASLGAGPGFMTGALTALISNMYYGQGLWTPFQMAAWGFIGILSGIFGKHISGSKLFLTLFGAASGVLYSLIMDAAAVVMSGEGFSPERYLSYLAAGLPVMGIYAVSNAVFLYIVGKSACSKLARIKRKYIF